MTCRIDRPRLHEIPVPDGGDLAGKLIFTMSIGQWDGLLHGAYDAGATLLELDANERVVRAYRRPAWSATDE